MKGFKNANVYVEGKGIVRSDLAFENGKITAIGNLDLDEIIEVPHSAVVLPGFIDQHIHGAAGCDAMDGSIDALSAIAKAVASEGTTGFLATTMTQSVDNINKALDGVNRYIAARFEDGAEVLGVHLEGPFISTKFVGAQPIEYVAKPSSEVFDEYNKVAGGNIKIVTLAPEVDGADELIAHLKEIGVVPSIGHTSAKYADIDKAIYQGASNVTHTYNAQTPLHHRDIGVVGSALSRDELNCEIICDTIHVSVPAIKLLIKNKPHDKVTLITDAMRAKHMPDGESELGGQLVIVKNGEARLVDGTLAGSVLKMNDAIKNLVLKAGVSLTDAVDFATANPAKNLGVYAERGSIAVGKRADFAILDEDFSVLKTIRGGKEVYFK